LLLDYVLLSKHLNILHAKYTVMYGDNSEVNKSYGIGAFPQVVLIGKDGKVIYSGGLDVERLESLIKSNM